MLYDLTSSYVARTHLRRRRVTRSQPPRHRVCTLRIVLGLLCTADGCPIAGGTCNEDAPPAVSLNNSRRHAGATSGGTDSACSASCWSATAACSPTHASAPEPATADQSGLRLDHHPAESLPCAMPIKVGAVVRSPCSSSFPWWRSAHAHFRGERLIASTRPDIGRATAAHAPGRVAGRHGGGPDADREGHSARTRVTVPGRRRTSSCGWAS